MAIFTPATLAVQWARIHCRRYVKSSAPCTEPTGAFAFPVFTSAFGSGARRSALTWSGADRVMRKFSETLEPTAAGERAAMRSMSGRRSVRR